MVKADDAMGIMLANLLRKYSDLRTAVQSG